jgi:hypothetical protein
MTARQFPEHPTLEQLKRQAKDLLQSARAGEPPLSRDSGRCRRSRAGPTATSHASRRSSTSGGAVRRAPNREDATGPTARRARAGQPLFGPAVAPE